MSEKFPKELWDNPVFHKGREWGRMEKQESIVANLSESWISDYPDENSWVNCLDKNHFEQLLSYIRSLDV